MSPETAAYPTDEQILDLPESAESEISSESPEATETPSQVETQTEEVSQEENLRPDQSKPETTAQPKPQDKQQGDKSGTTPEAQTIEAKAAELDRADEAFATGDVAGMAETFEQMFGDNPAGLTDAMWMGYRFLEQRSPEQFAQFSKMIVSDQLAQIGVKWETLVKLAGYLEKAGDRETFNDLNKLALMFKQVGHGPTQESQGSAVTNYSKQIGGMMERSVPALIRSVLGERFSSVKPADQQELLMAGKLAVKDFLARDPKVSEAFRKLGQKYSEKEGVRVYLEILAPKLRSIIPLVANNLANEYRELFKAIPASPQPARPAQPPAKPAIAAPRSMAEARARNMTMADVLKATEGEIASGSFLTQEDADGMSEMDVLNSRRVPLTRKPWRPGNELDGL